MNRIKRGISSVIAIVLIILITIAAVTIVWQVVIPLIKEKSEVGLSCEDARLDLELVSAKCDGEAVSTTTGVIRKTFSVQVKRGSGGVDIEEAKIFLYETGKLIYDRTIDIPQNKNQVSTISNNAIDMDGIIDATKSYEVVIAPIVNNEECDILPAKVEVTDCS